MNWLLNIFDSIKWKIEDAVWSVKDKVEMWKLDREIAKEYVNDTEDFAVEEIEVKPKKKKAKKKSAKKAKKSV